MITQNDRKTSRYPMEKVSDGNFNGFRSFQAILCHFGATKSHFWAGTFLALSSAGIRKTLQTLRSGKLLNSLRLHIFWGTLYLSYFWKSAWHSDIFIVNSRSTTYTIVKITRIIYQAEEWNNGRLNMSGAKTRASTMMTKMRSKTTTTPIVTIQVSHLMKESNH